MAYTATAEMAVFGKFELLEQIGGGRLSEVFRVARAGHHHGLNVALKRVLPSLITEDRFVKLVIREAGLLTRLDHGDLCDCHEMGVVDGCAFLTMQLVDGCTLRAMMRRLSQLGVTLPTPALIAIGQQLAGVLDYLHRHGDEPLVHLDLSPQNMLIARQGQLKLIDFGIARYLDGHNPPPLEGKIAGTVGYMAPEQAAGATFLDARADQFGLGVLLWEMCFGRRLFRGNTTETWRRMRSGSVPEVVVPADRPVELLKIIGRMLAPDPDDRFDNMGGVSEALDAVTSSIDGGARPLSALVNRLLTDPQFDPFDKVNLTRRQRSAPIAAGDIPTGEVPIGVREGEGHDEYEELSISVDHGHGTTAAQLRAEVPDLGDGPPVSPFIETLSDNNHNKLW